MHTCSIHVSIVYFSLTLKFPYALSEIGEGGFFINVVAFALAQTNGFHG